jgi:hypothetical protein
MVQAEVKTQDGTTIEIDTGDMEKRILESMNQQYRPMFEKYLKELKEQKPENKNGKGVVEAFMPDDRKAQIIEEFKKGEKLDPRKISEQWTVALPKMRSYEAAAHMRDFVYVTDEIKGKAGDTVNIPYVKDIEFEHVTTGTGAFTVKTGLINVLTTTLHESGAYYDAYYTDIEKIGNSMLDELNAVFAHAAVRAEDYDLFNLLDAGTTSAWGETAYGSTGVIKCGDYALAGSTFNVSWIADAIGRMILKGKDVHPGEMLIYMNPQIYTHFLKKVTASAATSYAFARPDITKSGMVEEWLGVRIITGGAVNRMTKTGGTGLTGISTTYQTTYLMRPKRCLALAPKRDILIETDKLIATRNLRIVASHTYGVALLDQTEAVPIHSGIV